MNPLLSLPVTLTIGRTPSDKSILPKDNEIFLPKRNISSQHATLTIFPDGVLQLKDTDSKYGTFIRRGDGQIIPIKQKYVNREDIILFADNAYRLEAILPERYKLQPTNGGEENPLDFTKEFAALKDAPEKFKKEQERIDNWEKSITLGSVIIGLVVSFILSIWENQYMKSLSAVGIGFLPPRLFSVLYAKDKLKRSQSKYNELYRCPNKTACHNPFGNIPWEYKALEKKCPKCKAIWVA